MDTKENLSVVQGKTFSDVVRFAVEPIKRKAITGISFASGAPRLTIGAGHECPNNWPVAVTLVASPKQINSANTPPRYPSDYHKALFISGTEIEFNDVDPVDEGGRAWAAYTSGGFIQYHTPVDLTGYKSRMAIREKANDRLLLKCVTGGTSGSDRPEAAGTDGTVTWEETTLQSTKQWNPSTVYVTNDVVDARALILLTETSGITHDNVTKTIARVVSATETAGLSPKTYYYEHEVESSTGVVTQLKAGKFLVEVEIAP